jgi:hypothetical protein
MSIIVSAKARGLGGNTYLIITNNVTTGFTFLKTRPSKSTSD